MPQPTSRCRSTARVTSASWCGRPPSAACSGRTWSARAPRSPRRLGLPALTGPYVFSVIGLLLAIAVVSVRLRPDPLLEARRRRIADGDDSGPAHGSVSRGLRVVAGIPAARLGLLTLALGHVVMVSVMVMTPLHMAHGDAGLEVIGLVISIHIVGMFAFSPLTGLAVDRFGGRAVAVVGSVILSTATLLASASPEGESTTLGLGLFLLGLGWSCTLVAGSTMLTAAVPAMERPGAQGASDLVMGLVAGLGGALAGVVVDRASFTVLALVALGVAVVVGLVAALSAVRHRTRPRCPERRPVTDPPRSLTGATASRC